MRSRTRSYIRVPMGSSFMTPVGSKQAVPENWRKSGISLPIGPRRSKWKISCMLSGMFVRPGEVWTMFNVHWSGTAFRPAAIVHWRKRRWVCFRVAQETVSERQSLDNVTMRLILTPWLKFLLSQSSRKWTLLIIRYSARNWIMERLFRRRRVWFLRLRKLSLNRIISNRSGRYPTHPEK